MILNQQFTLACEVTFECGPIPLRPGRRLSETLLSRLSDKTVAQPDEREF
jgi:hypothetical protein